MADFLQLLISGLATGAIYALAAIGFTLLWQTSQTINFAQGEFVMLPAFAMLVFAKMGLPLALAFVVTCALAVDSKARVGSSSLIFTGTPERGAHSKLTAH